MTDEVNNIEWLRGLLAAGMFYDNSDAIAALLSELDTLRARLEVTPQGPDGIDARDETIRALEGERDALRADAERYRWLRDVGDATWRPLGIRAGYSAKKADAAIDAARGMGEAQR